MLCFDPDNSGCGPNPCLYRFFAHSASQLRYRTCLLVNYDASFWQEDRLAQHAPTLRATLGQLDRLVDPADRLKRKRSFINPQYVWNYFGDFSKIKVVAKYSARIGLLFRGRNLAGRAVLVGRAGIPASTAFLTAGNSDCVSPATFRPLTFSFRQHGTLSLFVTRSGGSNRTLFETVSSLPTDVVECRPGWPSGLPAG